MGTVAYPDFRKPKVEKPTIAILAECRSSFYNLRATTEGLIRARQRGEKDFRVGASFEKCAQLREEIEGLLHRPGVAEDEELYKRLALSLDALKGVALHLLTLSDPHHIQMIECICTDSQGSASLPMCISVLGYCLDILPVAALPPAPS